MHIVKHIRISNAINDEVIKVAKSKNISSCAALREIIELGLRIKKHMEDNNSTSQEQEKFNSLLLEKGASSSIETLLLLRKMAHNINEKWMAEAHEEAFKRIDAILQ